MRVDLTLRLLLALILISSCSDPLSDHPSGELQSTKATEKSRIRAAPLQAKVWHLEPAEGPLAMGRDYSHTLHQAKQLGSFWSFHVGKDLSRELASLPDREEGSAQESRNLLLISGGHGDFDALFATQNTHQVLAKKIIAPLKNKGITFKLIVIDACVTGVFAPLFSELLAPNGLLIASLSSVSGAFAHFILTQIAAERPITPEQIQSRFIRSVPDYSDQLMQGRNLTKTLTLLDIDQAWKREHPDAPTLLTIYNKLFLESSRLTTSKLERTRPSIMARTLKTLSFMDQLSNAQLRKHSQSELKELILRKLKEVSTGQEAKTLFASSLLDKRSPHLPAGAPNPSWHLAQDMQQF